MDDQPPFPATIQREKRNRLLNKADKPFEAVLLTSSE